MTKARKFPPTLKEGLRVSEIEDLHKTADLLRWTADTHPGLDARATKRTLRLALQMEAIAGRMGTGLTREGWDEAVAALAGKETR